MKSIKRTILFSMILTTATSLSLLSIITIYFNYRNINATLKQTMTESVKLASERVSYEIKSYMNVATDIGRVASLSDPNVSLDEKQNIINQVAKSYGLTRGNIVDTNARSLFDDKAYAERDYYKKSMKGETYVSDPILSQNTGKITFIVSAPLWKDGIPNTEIVGIIYFVPQETFLYEIVSSIKMSKNGKAFILDSNGSIIASVDQEEAINSKNIINEVQTNKSLSSLASLEQKMIRGEIGFNHYTSNKDKMFLSYAPIEESNNWSLGISSPEKDYMSSTVMTIIIIILFLIVTCLVCTLIAFWLANKIGKPIKQCSERIELLARGDLKTPVPQIKGKDELAILAQATKKIVSNMNDIISDISWVLEKMAVGNFNIDIKEIELYVGDFQPIAQSMYGILKQFTNTFIQMNESSDQVTTASKQAENGAQILSESATEQSYSMQELASTIEEVSEHVKQDTQSAQQASQKANNVGQEMLQSNEQMQLMIEAITKISNTSSEIEKILKIIEEIAFQTNILALNASVEAARTGEAGKGFTVVADEINKLAKKSSQASQNISDLIKSSMQAVENGTEIANKTANSLLLAVEGANDIAKTINKISDTSVEQAESITQIIQKINQISNIIYLNSNTTEKNVEASKNLSDQAQTLKNLISKFQLKV